MVGNYKVGIFVNSAANSAIHEAASLTPYNTSFAWHNSCGMEKCPLAMNGSHWQERSLESVLYGGTQSGGFVNSAVRSFWPASDNPLALWIYRR